MKTFNEAVKMMFQEEMLSLKKNHEEAAKHLGESEDLKKHILIATREVISEPTPTRIAATLNAFFEFGYRAHRFEKE